MTAHDACIAVLGICPFCGEDAPGTGSEPSCFDLIDDLGDDWSAEEYA